MEPGDAQQQQQHIVRKLSNALAAIHARPGGTLSSVSHEWCRGGRARFTRKHVKPKDRWLSDADKLQSGLRAFRAGHESDSPFARLRSHTMSTRDEALIVD